MATSGWIRGGGSYARWLRVGACCRRARLRETLRVGCRAKTALECSLFVKEGGRPRLTEAGGLLQRVCITMVHDEQSLQRSIEVLQPPPRHRRQVLVDHRAAAPGPEGPVGRHSRGQPALHKRRSGGSRRHRGRGPRKRGPNAKGRTVRRSDFLPRLAPRRIAPISGS